MLKSTLPISRADAGRPAAPERVVGRAVGFAPALSSRGAGWNSVALFAWRGHCDQAVIETLEEPAIVYHTAGAQSVPVRVGRAWDRRTHPGLITVIPPATAIRWDIRGEVHSYTVHLRSRFFSATATDDAKLRERLRFRCGVADPLLASSIAALARELHEPAEQGPLYAESVSDMMALHLLRDASSPVELPKSRGGLSRTALQRTLDLLQSRLEKGVSLQELADEASLSRAYFAEAFRRATGLSPHRYLTQRRIEQAQGLLHDRALSLAEVALRCGFANQAHFTEAFRRSVGVTPSRFRDGLG